VKFITELFELIYLKKYAAYYCQVQYVESIWIPTKDVNRVLSSKYSSKPQSCESQTFPAEKGLEKKEEWARERKSEKTIDKDKTGGSDSFVFSCFRLGKYVLEQI